MLAPQGSKLKHLGHHQMGKIRMGYWIKWIVCTYLHISKWNQNFALHCAQWREQFSCGSSWFSSKALEAFFSLQPEVDRRRLSLLLHFLYHNTTKVNVLTYSEPSRYWIVVTVRFVSLRHLLFFLSYDRKTSKMSFYQWARDTLPLLW